MPLNRHLSGLDVAPPLLKLLSGNVVCGRCDQVIKNDGVLFLPPEIGDGHQVIVVEKVPGQGAAGDAIERSIDQLGREINKGRG